MRQLPPEIRRSMADKVENLNAEETAKLADAYFDKDGRVENVPSAPPISNVAQSSPPNFTESFIDESDSINVVNRNQRRFPNTSNARQQPTSSAPRPPRHPPPSSSWSAFSNPASHPQQRRPPNPAPQRPHGTVTRSGLCDYHVQYGDDAMKCAPGCRRFPGNARAGRRT